MEAVVDNIRYACGSWIDVLGACAGELRGTCCWGEAYHARARGVIGPPEAFANGLPVGLSIVAGGIDGGGSRHPSGWKNLSTVYDGSGIICGYHVGQRAGTI